ARTAHVPRGRRRLLLRRAGQGLDRGPGRQPVGGVRGQGRRGRDAIAAGSGRELLRAVLLSAGRVRGPGSVMPGADLRRRAVAEGIGTMLLVATVIGSGIMAERLSAVAPLALLANTLATGAV